MFHLRAAAGGIAVLRGDLDGVIAALDRSRRATLVMRAGVDLAVLVAAAALVGFALIPLGPPARRSPPWRPSSSSLVVDGAARRIGPGLSWA